MNGPNGMYSSDFFILLTNNIILRIAPIKNDTNVTAIILYCPKNNPKAPISFTSPNPIASFPYIAPTYQCNKNIPPPISIPINIFIVIATSDNPYKNANIIPISNIVRLSLLGIICNL